MFIKLLKYDLKAMGRILIPFWILAFVIGVLWMRENQKYMYEFRPNLTLEQIFGIMFVLLIFAVITLNLVIIIQYFWKGLLKEEGYLMFTLPVSVRSLILSKAISALIICCITIAVGWMLVLVMEVMRGFVLGDFLKYYFGEFDTYRQGILVIVEFFLLYPLKWIYQFYASMALGQLKGQNRLFWSIGAFCCCLVLFHILEMLISWIVMNVWKTEILYQNMSQTVFFVVLILEILICHAVTEYILTKKLNLE